MNNYGTPLKLEAGFYSSSLISYLVNSLHMPITQTKNKITTKRALKPDTFKPFVKYVFDNFEEVEAKKLVNSYIGELGRKYNKINQGFTCTEHDTVMCCWTSTMADNRNVRIDYYSDLYLIREQIVERLISDNTSINRFVVLEAILKCLQLLEACYSKDNTLYSYNTDGIFISNPKIIFKNKKYIKVNTKKRMLQTPLYHILRNITEKI